MRVFSILSKRSMLDNTLYMLYNILEAEGQYDGQTNDKTLFENGWKLLRVQGSHYIMIRKGRTEPVPYHTSELRNGMEKHLLKVLKEVS